MATNSTVLKPDDIGIIMLAAGYSRRFGADKRLALMPDGRSLLENTLSRVPADFSFSRRLLVLHPGDEALAEVFAEDWPVCFAADAAAGLGHSLAAAVSLVPEDWQGALIALADMPAIEPATYQKIRLALCQHDIVRPVCRQQYGNPCGFRAKYFSMLASLSGDRGARDLLQREQAAVYLLDCEDAGTLKDVDEKSDVPAGRAGTQNKKKPGQED